MVGVGSSSTITGATCCSCARAQQHQKSIMHRGRDSQPRMKHRMCRPRWGRGEGVQHEPCMQRRAQLTVHEPAGIEPSIAADLTCPPACFPASVPRAGCWLAKPARAGVGCSGQVPKFISSG
jgi:hypothetical protein